MTAEALRIEALLGEAAGIKNNIHRQRRRLVQIMTTVEQLKARCEDAGIEFGVATKRESEHGP